jgi:hypothetical protein
MFRFPICGNEFTFNTPDFSFLYSRRINPRDLNRMTSPFVIPDTTTRDVGRTTYLALLYVFPSLCVFHRLLKLAKPPSQRVSSFAYIDQAVSIGAADAIKAGSTRGFSVSWLDGVLKGTPFRPDVPFPVWTLHISRVVTIVGVGHGKSLTQV